MDLSDFRQLGPVTRLDLILGAVFIARLAINYEVEHRPSR
jgi:hypothetical protein